MRCNLRFVLYIVTLIFAVYNFAFAQKLITGKIVNNKDNTPIPFANIWIYGTNYGTSSLENGNFSLLCDSINLNMSLKISVIGFHDTLIYYKNIDKIIKLVPKVYEITEIKILPQKAKVFIINDLDSVKLISYLTNDSTPRIVGLFLPYKSNYHDCNIINKILIYTSGEKRFRFNLRIYSYDTIAMQPIKELVTENILVTSNKSIVGKPNFVEIDMLKYNVEFPKEGLLIGVEWLIIPQNKFKMFTYFDNTIIRKSTLKVYGPCLTTTLETNGKVWQYRQGRWTKCGSSNLIGLKNFEKKYFNPAISVVMTN